MNICIIGGNGRTGSQFNELLAKHGHTVTVIGRESSNDAKKYAALITAADIILLSVQLPAIETAIATLSKCADTCSLKGKLVANLASIMDAGAASLDSLAKKTGCIVCNIHPMFGPDAKTFVEHNILIAQQPAQQSKNSPQQSNQPPKLQILREIFAKEKMNIIDTTRDEHDRLTAIVQAFSQYTSLAFARTLADQNVPLSKLLAFSPTTFRLNTKAIERMLLQPSELWFNIQVHNEHVDRIENDSAKTQERLRTIIKSKDAVAFEAEFAAIKKYWEAKKEN